MIAIEEARRLIASNPHSDPARVLRDLVVALESHEKFELERLYGVDLKTFELAVSLIQEWRLDRYFAKKGKLVDLSLEAQALSGFGPLA
ncbi:hypothetical protein [Pseudorhodoferax sp. Leaf265]|uniref:hypothetical protein n=1 Tax=Pseudorhodoferax sp. Leaf265 TaxID=1736315 RepID=UPI0006FF2B0C|nr:hypothetical protein [Pseudorhodoferax sp. Leaf265]KQP15561.1 hypothetical protein ASF45_28610 [Pseudorhodoferax sp. Leaf265]